MENGIDIQVRDVGGGFKIGQTVADMKDIGKMTRLI